MSGGRACLDSTHDRVVVCRNHNHSAFNGYQRTSSDYSLVHCRTCGAMWRSKAGYLASLPDAPEQL